MKVLWFVSNTSNYRSSKGGYNGCGWISSIENAIKADNTINLNVSFILNGEDFKITQNGVTYYPIEEKPTSIFSRIHHALNKKTEFNIHDYSYYLDAIRAVVEDCKPDIIQVFGSENIWGLVSVVTKIPVVLHIQGILNPYYTAFLPPFISWKKFIFSGRTPLKSYKLYRDKINIEIGANREKYILSRIHNYIGRTEWDYRITKLYNPHAKYYYGSEVLRPTFYEGGVRETGEKIKISTTISAPFYKGIDLVFNTAKILKDICKIDFEWIVFGNIDWCNVCTTFNFDPNDKNVIFEGVADADKLKQCILTSTVYVHPSYIDNSPNSVCEAQILGCPVIATNVGGVSSLIKDKESGYLVPANDPYQTAFLILQLHNDKELNINIGNKGKAVATKRHDTNTIVKNLISVYKKILSI